MPLLWRGGTVAGSSVVTAAAQRPTHSTTVALCWRCHACKEAFHDHRSPAIVSVVSGVRATTALLTCLDVLCCCPTSWTSRLLRHRRRNVRGHCARLPMESSVRGVGQEPVPCRHRRCPRSTRTGVQVSAWGERQRRHGRRRRHSCREGETLMPTPTATATAEASSGRVPRSSRGRSRIAVVAAAPWMPIQRCVVASRPLTPRAAGDRSALYPADVLVGTATATWATMPAVLGGGTAVRRGTATPATVPVQQPHDGG
jgi:hypothetical protein